MAFHVRPENEADYRAVEALTREAFWNRHAPGCNEHYLVHILRNSDAFVKELDFVAVCRGKVMGNIMYTRAFILGDDLLKHPVLSFGPVSVLPEFQRKGVGGRLIEHTKSIARDLGYAAIIIYGDPEFYKRTGFRQAEAYSIGTSANTYAASLLACELTPGALEAHKGRFFEDAIYEIDQAAAEEFDATFPLREKRTGLPGQLRFSELARMTRPRL